MDTSTVEKDNLKMTNSTTSSPCFSSSSLTDEIIVNCLAWTSRTYYPSLYLVCKSFHTLLSSPDIYTIRSQIGVKEPCLYLSLVAPSNHQSWVTLTNTSPDQTLISNGGEINKGELSLTPVTLSHPSNSSHARLLNSSNVAVASEIYQIGGTIKDRRSKAVFVFDCRSHKWRRVCNMIVARKHAKSCLLDGKIYVIEGCKEPMDWGEVFDLQTQTWKPLSSPTDNMILPRHKIVVFGGRLYFITVDSNKYAYDPKGGWVVPEVGFVGIEPISSIIGPWCVINNVMFIDELGMVKWYNPSRGRWDKVYGLDDLYANRVNYNRTFQLVNHGGKLVIIWCEWTMITDGPHVIHDQDKKIWCAVIRLEKKYKSQFRGKVERCNVVLTVLKSCKLSSCLSVTV